MAEAGDGPLAGVRVLDLTTAVLGPLATQILGDMGADVIKVESPSGDSLRHLGPSRTPLMGAYFLNLNRNKRSIVLDLKQPPARRALDDLIATADVLVHNMRLGAARRLGIEYGQLAGRYPRLILACATGFRPGSRLEEQPAFDDLIQGMSGLAVLNAFPDGAPRYFPTVAADKITGQMLASAIGMALYHRERTGAGQEVHVPMMETMLSFILVEHLWGATICEPERGLGYPRMRTPHRRPYATKDGYICVIALSDDQWRRLFAAIDRPGLIDDPRFATVAARGENIDTVYALLSDALRERTSAEWRERLTAADIPNSPANTLSDLLVDTYLQETGFFKTEDHASAGRICLTTPPVSFSASPASIRRLPPKLGEHTSEVLHEVGYSEDQITALSR